MLVIALMTSNYYQYANYIPKVKYNTEILKALIYIYQNL